MIEWIVTTLKDNLVLAVYLAIAHWRVAGWFASGAVRHDRWWRCQDDLLQSVDLKVTEG